MKPPSDTPIPPAQGDGGPLLRLHQLRAGYGEAEVLHGLDLEVRPGETLFVLGPNGAGKSTLLRSVVGRLPSSGQVLFGDQEIAELDTRERLHFGIALCPEGRRLFPEMTVEENLRLGAHLRVDRREVERDLEDLRTHLPWLAERRRQKVGTLSGGEQQMIAVARALMARPRLLLLDEPTVGLSAAAIRQLESWLRVQSRQRGVTILGTEQNVVFARNLADRIAILAGGKVRAIGPPPEVLPEEAVGSQLGSRIFGVEFGKGDVVA